jgi:hypothetical protein
VRRLAALGLLVLAVTPAARAQPAPPARWRGTGVVLALLPPPSSLHATRPVVLLEHEAIPGLMDERMSMPFIAASADLLRGVAVGDHVRFVLQETSDALLVISLERVR